MIKIGILLCDEHYPEAVERYGTYDVDFKNMLGGDQEIDWHYRIWRCYEGGFPDSVKDCDAWIISGSQWGAYDPEPWIKDLKCFIRRLDQAGSRVLGVCFGHQVIHSALGGQVKKAEQGWGLGAYPIELYANLGSIPSGTSLRLLAMHQDQVIAMADGFALIGGAGFCPHAITRKSSNILTFQAHPEFEDGFYRGLCEHIRGKADDDAIDYAISQLGKPDDRELVRQFIRDFMKSGNCG